MAVVGMEFFIEDSGSNEQQTSRGDDRTAVVIRCGGGNAFGDQLRIFTEWNLPQILAGVHVDRAECSPGRCCRRIIFGIKKSTKADGLVGHVVLGAAACCLRGYRLRGRTPLLLLWSPGQVVHNVLDLLVTQAVEGRHAAFAGTDGGGNLLIGEDTLNPTQGRNGGRGPGAVDAVTHAALVLIDLFSRAPRRRRNRQANQPRGVISVDVEHSSRRVDGRSAPLAASGEARHAHGYLLPAARNDLTAGTH